MRKSIIYLAKKKTKSLKKTLDDLLKDKSVVTGKEVIHKLKELEKQFEESAEDELRHRRVAQNYPNN